jgi:predicted dehydrogenase
MMRRFLHAGRFVRWACESGLLGRIHSFEIRDGILFNWPVASSLFFRREASGGGVLVDTGPHALDQMLWWLGGVEEFEYFDNSAGGVESDCELHIRLRSGAEGVIELSRTRRLPNAAVLRGEKGEIEVALGKNHLSLRLSGAPHGLAGEAAPENAVDPAAQSQLDIMAAEHADWLGAIRSGTPPEVTGADAREHVAIIESCYRKAQPLGMPWSEPGFVTGARAWNA